MIEKLAWLGKKEELAFRELKFRGENSGKIYKLRKSKLFN